MIFSHQSDKQKYYALKDWHRWFAWYPVKVSENGKYEATETYWLELVERKHDGSDDYHGPSFIYRKPVRVPWHQSAAGRALHQSKKS